MQSLKRFLLTERVTRVGGPLPRQHPGSFATTIPFFTGVLPHPPHAGSKGPERGIWAAPQTPAAPRPVLSSVQRSPPSHPQSTHVPRRPKAGGGRLEGWPAPAYLDEPEPRAPSHPRAHSVTVLIAWVPRTSRRSVRRLRGSGGRGERLGSSVAARPGPAGSRSHLPTKVRLSFSSRPPGARLASAASPSVRPATRLGSPPPLRGVPPLPSLLLPSTSVPPLCFAPPLPPRLLVFSSSLGLLRAP